MKSHLLLLFLTLGWFNSGICMSMFGPMMNPYSSMGYGQMNPMQGFGMPGGGSPYANLMANKMAASGGGLGPGFGMPGLGLGLNPGGFNGFHGMGGGFGEDLSGAAKVLSGIKGLGFGNGNNGQNMNKKPASANPTIALKPQFSNKLDGKLREEFFADFNPIEKIQYLRMRKATGFKSSFNLASEEDERMMDYERVRPLSHSSKRSQQKHQQQQQQHQQKSSQESVKTLSSKAYKKSGMKKFDNFEPTWIEAEY